MNIIRMMMVMMTIMMIGKSQELSCEVVGYDGAQEPTLQWTIITKDGLTSQPLSEWDPISQRSSISLTPQIPDDGKEISCRNLESGEVRRGFII